MIYDVTTPGQISSGGENFQDMCQIDQCEGTASFVAIRRVLREVLTKNHGGPFDPLASARVKKSQVAC